MQKQQEPYNSIQNCDSPNVSQPNKSNEVIHSVKITIHIFTIF